MITHISQDEVIKLNMIRLAQEHREHCRGLECNISLHWIEHLLKKAGISLSDEERKEFR